MGRWSEVSVGDELGPLTVVVDEELHRRFLDGSGNDLRVHDDLVDPTLAGNLAIRLLGSRYPGSIVHSHQQLRYFAPVRVGASLEGRGVVTMKEMRRGKAYVAADCDFTTAGERVWWARLTCVWPEVHLRGET